VNCMLKPLLSCGAILVAITISTNLAFAQGGSCAVIVGTSNQACTIIEDPNAENLLTEPVITVASVFAPDLQVGFVALSEPGDTQTGASATSDFLLFPAAAGSTFAGSMSLISYSTAGNLPAGYSIDITHNQIDAPGGIVLNYLGQTKQECAPEGILGCGVTFTLAEGDNLQFTDTFTVISDPVPEPSAVLPLLALGVVFWIYLRRKAVA
jgi:hypothetical protein